MSLPFDSSDRTQVRERNRRLRVTEREKGDFIRNMMNSRQGRAWMHSLLVECHVWRTSFSLDALAMAFNEGERNVGLKLNEALTEHAPDKYMEMIAEAQGEPVIQEPEQE